MGTGASNMVAFVLNVKKYVSGYSYSIEAVFVSPPGVEAPFAEVEVITDFALEPEKDVRLKKQIFATATKATKWFI